MSTGEAAFIIGGYILNFGGGDMVNSSIVAEFSQLRSENFGSWKHRGDLLRARSSAQAIQLADPYDWRKIMSFVIGGHGEQDR